MTRNTDGRVVVTDNMLNTLREWQDKTGYGMTSLFRHAEIAGLFIESKSLNPRAFNCIVAGTTKTVFESDFKSVIRAYQSLTPEMYGRQHALSRRKQRIPVTNEFKVRLLAFFENKTMSRAKILKYSNAPKDLTSSKIGLILNRENTTILKAHAAFLEKLMSSNENR